jgi:hypothetical protein
MNGLNIMDIFPFYEKYSIETCIQSTNFDSSFKATWMKNLAALTANPSPILKGFRCLFIHFGLRLRVLKKVNLTNRIDDNTQEILNLTRN